MDKEQAIQKIIQLRKDFKINILEVIEQESRNTLLGADK